jgi:hypothetical protein
MKITTEYCIYAIMKHFYEKDDNYPNLSALLKFKNWKRLSKTGSGYGIERTFQNRETGTIVIVQSSETDIFRVYETAASKNPNIMNIKTFLREKLQEVEYYGELPYEIFGEENVVNWPIVEMKEISDDPDDKFENEPLDMENFEWLSITDNEIKVCCGGDWQAPQTLTIVIVNGKLTVTNAVEEEYQEGMDEQQFLNAIR